MNGSVGHFFKTQIFDTMKKNRLKIYSTFMSIFFLLCAAGANAQLYWNQAAQFAGNTTSYISIPNSSTVNLTGSFTLEAWVNPSSVSTTDKGIISKGSTLGASLRYALRIIPGGRITISTNGIVRLTSSGTVPANSWRHVCATYNSATDSFAIYINGVLNVRALVVSATPASNTDSLYIGVSGTSASFAGLMDDVRIWNKSLTTTEVATFYRTSLATTGAYYNGMILSLAFQKQNSGGTVFTLTDWSGNGNNGFNRGIAAADQSNIPSTTIFPNESIEFNGTSDYLKGNSNSLIIPSSAITIEAWIYPRSVAGSRVIVSKNSATSYMLNLNAGKIEFFPKGGAALLTSKMTLIANRWWHIAATYNGTSTNIYINGELDTASTGITGAIGSNTDSLRIGCDVSGGFPVNLFNGYIDELRIANYAKTIDQINSFFYRSIDSTNQPNSAMTNVSYNLDGSTFDNGDGGPMLECMNGARFSHPASVENQPISPLNRADLRSFISGYSMKKTDRRIPASGGSGTIYDTLVIPFNTSIYDINLFVALNHKIDADLDLYLISPSGESIDFSTDNTMVGTNDNIVTIFDDQADYSVTALSHVSFAPVIRPEKNFSTIFLGDNSQGAWKLRITDDGTTTDTGRLYGWGIQFNNADIVTSVTTLDLTLAIEGFWDGVSHVQDSVVVYLRNSTAPYAISDSGRIFLSTTGNGSLSFLNIGASSKYIVIKHRNGLETWSATPQSFTIGGITSYDFTTAASMAYGNNLKLKSGKYCIYSGDVSKDGAIDASDVSLIDNDASNFVVGYVGTDLNGDNFVDGTDFSIADNNATLFIFVITP